MENQYNPLEQRESYAHYLGRLTRYAVQGTVQLAGRLVAWSTQGLERLMSPEVKIISTDIDHDKMHIGIHNDYNRIK